jgi:hypothetical protein
MFIKKFFCVFLGRLCCAHLHSKFRKNATKCKKNVTPKIQYGYQNAEFHADFKSVENVPKKVISKNMTEICTFSLLLMFIRLVLIMYNIFWYIFSGHFSTFLKL